MRSILAAIVWAGLLVGPVCAQPAVEVDRNGRTVQRFEPTPDGNGAVVEDWRGRSLGTVERDNGRIVRRDWKGAPE